MERSNCRGLASNAHTVVVRTDLDVDRVPAHPVIKGKTRATRTADFISAICKKLEIAHTKMQRVSAYSHVEGFIPRLVRLHPCCPKQPHRHKAAERCNQADRNDIVEGSNPVDECLGVEITVLNEWKWHSTIGNEAVRRHPRMVDAQCVEDSSGTNDEREAAPEQLPAIFVSARSALCGSMPDATHLRVQSNHGALRSLVRNAPAAAANASVHSWPPTNTHVST